uniref:Uncharacterized protein n=1 Tax=Helianthus annuus TaxID=4232 RepID=A0A251T081_HELAN
MQGAINDSVTCVHRICDNRSEVNVKGARMKIKRRARTEHDYEISFRTMYCYYVKRRMYT